MSFQSIEEGGGGTVQDPEGHGRSVPEGLAGEREETKATTESIGPKKRFPDSVCFEGTDLQVAV